MAGKRFRLPVRGLRGTPKLPRQPKGSATLKKAATGTKPRGLSKL